MVPVTHRYRNLITTLNKSSSEKVKEYKKKILGSDLIKESHPEYDMLAFLFGMEIFPDKWEEWDIHTKAKTLAYAQLKSQLEVLDRHDREQEEKKKKLNQKAGKKNG